MKYSALFQSSKGREMGKELQQLSISCLLSFLFPLFASPLLQKMGADGLKKEKNGKHMHWRIRGNTISQDRLLVKRQALENQQRLPD